MTWSWSHLWAGVVRIGVVQGAIPEVDRNAEFAGRESAEFGHVEEVAFLVGH